jgi:hypothetical protein
VVQEKVCPLEFAHDARRSRTPRHRSDLGCGLGWSLRERNSPVAQAAAARKMYERGLQQPCVRFDRQRYACVVVGRKRCTAVGAQEFFRACQIPRHQSHAYVKTNVRDTGTIFTKWCVMQSLGGFAEFTKMRVRIRCTAPRRSPTARNNPNSGCPGGVARRTLNARGLGRTCGSVV